MKLGLKAEIRKGVRARETGMKIRMETDDGEEMWAAGCDEQPGNQGSMCRESFGHGAEVGGAGWGKVVNFNSLWGRDHFCGQAMTPSFLPFPHAWACCHIP